MEPKKDEFLKELRDIQTSLTIRGTTAADEWLLDVAYRMYNAIETHLEKQTPTTKMKTVTEIRIDNTLVEIKSKKDKDAPSGWSVIAFTPACSLRCVRVDDWEWLKRFVRAIIEAAGPQDCDAYDYFEPVCKAVESILPEERTTHYDTNIK
tara:strand:+ start:248 stop:700 length:453 start_codon:yes stop_codon:yes gene_type:complete